MRTWESTEKAGKCHEYASTLYNNAGIENVKVCPYKVMNGRSPVPRFRKRREQ